MAGLKIVLEEMKGESDSGVLGTSAVAKTKPVYRLTWVLSVDEALLTFGVGDFLCGQDFDGDLTSEAALDGTVDLTHPSRPQRRLDLVGPEFCASD